MDRKLFVRVGVAVFVAIAITMTLLSLREEPPVPAVESGMVWQPDGDPLAEQLRICAAIGENALSWPDCHAAWAEKRRRFLGTENKPGTSPPTALVMTKEP